MLEVISVLEVISSVQLHILVCLPNKMATILQENEFYLTAAAVVAVTAAAVIV
jgi:hypothetical protein